MVRCSGAHRLRSTPHPLERLRARQPLRRLLQRVFVVGGVAGVPAQAAECVKNRTAILVLLLLGSAWFSLATILQPRAVAYSQSGQDNALKVLLGDGRRIF